MGIYIKGMKMPTDRSRWVVIYPDGKVEYSDKTDKWETLDKGAVPVPPHGRLGDLDAIMERLEYLLKYCDPESHAAQRTREMMVEIMCARTIIPAEE